MGKRYLINFDRVPPKGTRVEGWKGVWLTLVAVKPWTRADGTETHLLEWEAEDGRRAVSGMRCRGPRWETIEGVVERSRAWRRAQEASA